MKETTGSSSDAAACLGPGKKDLPGPAPRDLNNEAAEVEARFSWEVGYAAGGLEGRIEVHSALEADLVEKF